jgi:predicted CoA-binding protein
VTEYADPEAIARLKATPAVWAVVGLGANPERAAFGVARFLQTQGMRIVPVYPRAEVVHGEQGYSTLTEAAASVGHIDVVDCFVNSGRVGAIVDEAIAIGADAVWLQLDVIDEAAAQRAQAAGLTVIMNRCPAIEFPQIHSLD